MLIDDRVIAQLAPEGRLRVALNLSNVLLVKMDGHDPSSLKFTGVAPGIAAAIATQLGTAPIFVPFPDAGALADRVADNLWDIALIGADPACGASIAFTSA
jgi:polar amino acid transport system substrate-binding protein